MQEAENYSQPEPLTTRSHNRINDPQRLRGRVWRVMAVSLAVVMVLVSVIAWLLLSHELQRGTQTARGSVGKTLYTYYPDQLHLDSFTSVDWSPDGKRIAVSGLTMITFDALTGKHITSYGPGSESLWTAWSPDGTRIALSSDDVKVVDARTGRVLVTYTPPIIRSSASISIHAGNPKASFRGSILVYASVWSPDGKMIASAVNVTGVGNDVQIWNVSTGARVRTFQIMPNTNYNGYIPTVAWSPDGKYIAASDDKVVQVWNAATGHKVTTFHGSSNPIFSIAWSPDGQYIVSPGSNGTTQVWKATTGHVLYSFQAQSGPNNVEFLAWSPDGKYIAVGNQVVRIFSAANGNLIYTYAGHGKTPDVYISALSWSPDSTMIVSLSNPVDVMDRDRHLKSMKVWIAS